MKLKNLFFIVALYISGFISANEPVKINFDINETWNTSFFKTEKSFQRQSGNVKITYDSLGFYNRNYPVFFHSGEIQYFRIPEDQWEDVILKAKNGGLNCIATCVYWGIHEPKDNIWNFKGRYDIKKFLSLCEKYGLYVILRIGPVINAETRNAGLPQWVRAQLPGQYHHLLYPTSQWFFEAVDDYYQHLAHEVKDYFPSNGGNIVMVQLDNETNCSWIWGRQETQKDAQITIDTYQELAKKAGFEGPFTSTYWEPTHAVRAKGSIPGTGAYPLGNWHLKKTYPLFDGFKLTKTNHFEGFKDTLNYPVLSIENQGGGGYYTITPAEFPAFYNLADIASGVNATSFYIYGAGTNPQRYPGPWFSDNVGKSVARPDVTQMSYDLHSPLGEFQQVRDSYHYIRRAGLFLDAFGGTLQKLSYLNADTLTEIFGKKHQVCMRQRDGSGFVFVNAYKLPFENRKEAIQFQLASGKDTIRFPRFSKLHVIQNKPLILPFRLNIAGLHFMYATANPLTVFNDDNFEHLVFYANGNDTAEFWITECSSEDILANSGYTIYEHDNGLAFTVDPENNTNVLIIQRENQRPLAIKMITEEMSLKAGYVVGLPDKLVFTSLIPLDVKNGRLRFEYNSQSGETAQFSSYPASGFSVKNYLKQYDSNEAELKQPSLPLVFQEEHDGYSFTLRRKNVPEQCREIYINITPPEYFQGAELWSGNMLVADTYYHLSGDSVYAPWSFGLKRFLCGNSTQWVIERQPEDDVFRIYHKQNGKLLGYAGDRLCLLEDLNSGSGLWRITGETGQMGLKHISTGRFLAIRGSQPELSGKPFFKWNIRHSDDFYAVISAGRDQYLSLHDDEVKLSGKEDEINFKLKSFKFEVSLKDFTFKREEGLFSRPESYTFLLDKTIKIKNK